LFWNFNSFVFGQLFFGITIAKESRINIAGLWITATIQKYCIKLFMEMWTWSFGQPPDS